MTEADAPTRQLIFGYKGNHIAAVSDGTGRAWRYSYTRQRADRVDAPSDAQTPQATLRYDYYTDTALGGLAAAGHRAQRRDHAVHVLRQPPRLPGHRPRRLHSRLLLQPLQQPNHIHRQARQRRRSTGTTRPATRSRCQHPDGSHETTSGQTTSSGRTPTPSARPRSYQYDAAGEHRRSPPTATAMSPRFTYEPAYQPGTSTTRSAAGSRQYEYDAHGNLHPHHRRPGRRDHDDRRQPRVDAHA